MVFNNIHQNSLASQLAFFLGSFDHASTGAVDAVDAVDTVDAVGGALKGPIRVWRG